MQPFASSPDDYVSNQIKKTASIGIGVGYQFNHPAWAPVQWLPHYRLGVVYDYIGNTTVNGYINKYQETPSAYDLQYQLNSSVLWAVAQADLITWKTWGPFVEGGIGAAWNRAYDYHETPEHGWTPRDSAAFTNRTTLEPAWMLGAGINYECQIEQRTVNIAMGYRFTSLGNTKTGASPTYANANHGLTHSIQNNEIVLAVRTNL